jgi:hypothetical protein
MVRMMEKVSALTVWQASAFNIVHCAFGSVGSTETSINGVRNVEITILYLIKLTVEKKPIPGENTTCQTDDIKQEMTMIIYSNAIVYPWTMTTTISLSDLHTRL